MNGLMDECVGTCAKLLLIASVSQTQIALSSSCAPGQEAWALTSQLLTPASYLIQIGTRRMTSR